MGTTTTTMPGYTTTTTQPGGGGGGGSNPFVDDDNSVFENSIEWLAAEGITQGCNPPLNDRFCPNDRVTRGQMATFLVRALDYPGTSHDWFVDDEAVSSRTRSTASGRPVSPRGATHPTTVDSAPTPT